MSDADMAAVALASDSPTYDEVGTGEIEVQSVRVKTKLETPDPVPYGDVADLTWRMPSVLPRRGWSPLLWTAVLVGVAVAPLVIVGILIEWAGLIL